MGIKTIHIKFFTFPFIFGVGGEIRSQIKAYNPFLLAQRDNAVMKKAERILIILYYTHLRIQNDSQRDIVFSA